MQTDAKFFDGASAGSQNVRVTFTGYSLEFRLDDRSHSIAIDDVEIQEPVGSGMWNVTFPDEAHLQFSDKEFGRQLLSSTGSSDWISRLEGSWRWAIGALAVAVVGTWAILTYVVPYGSKQFAMSLPAETLVELGDSSIEAIDKLLFEETKLPIETQQRVRAMFEDIQSLNPEYELFRLEFRSAEDIGPNAFAIPGGVVVMTDEIIELAQSDAEIQAVLAHEVGHLVERHVLRSILQNSISALVTAALIGDVASITALAATIPTVLLNSKHSRDFEREADEFSFDYLDSRNIDSNALSQLLQRIEAEYGVEDDDGNIVNTWLSTHPRSSERVRD